MKSVNLSLCMLLFTVITLNSYAGVSVFKVPGNVRLEEYKFTNDYIWYQVPEQQYTRKVARLHVPSSKSQVFNLFNTGSYLSAFEVPDSNHCAVINELGDLAYFNGTSWIYTKNKSIEFLRSTKQGTIFMSSKDYFGYIQNDSVKLIPRNSIGLSDNPIAGIAADGTGNFYVMNLHKIAKYDGLNWKVIFHDDSVSLQWFSMLPDNSVYLAMTGELNYGKISSDSIIRFTLAQMDSVVSQVSWLPKDANGNIWDLKLEDDGMEMINGNDTTNSSNALARGWKNWPDIPITTGKCATSGKHVYIAIENGFYYYDGGPNRIWEWIPLCQTFDVLFDTIGASTLVQSPDSSIYIYHTYSSYGLHRYKNGKFYTLPGSASHTICVDHKGVLWVSYGDNLCRYEEPFYKKVVSMGGIRQIIEDNTGRIMVLTVNNKTIELEIFRQAGTEWELINQSNSNIPNSKNGIKILQAPDGTYWCCTGDKGVAKSTDLHNWITYDTSNSILPSNHTKDMVLDLDGNLIVAFRGNDYKPIDILKFSGNKWIHLGLPAIKMSGNLNVDHYGKVWYGMAYHDGTKWNIVDDSLNLNTFIVDYSGTLWAAIGNKIYLTTNDEFYKFNSKVGQVKPGVKNNRYKVVSVRCIPGIATAIEYTIDKPAYVTIAIYSVQGKLVATLKNGYLNSGTYSTVWNNGGARGLYVLRFLSQGFSYNVPIKNL